MRRNTSKDDASSWHTFWDFSCSLAFSRVCISRRAASIAAAFCASRFCRAILRASGSPSTSCGRSRTKSPKWPRVQRGVERRPDSIAAACREADTLSNCAQLVNLEAILRRATLCARRLCNTCWRLMKTMCSSTHDFTPEQTSFCTWSSSTGPLVGALSDAAGRGGARCCCCCCCLGGAVAWPFARAGAKGLAAKMSRSGSAATVAAAGGGGCAGAPKKSPRSSAVAICGAAGAAGRAADPTSMPRMSTCRHNCRWSHVLSALHTKVKVGYGLDTACLEVHPAPHPAGTDSPTACESSSGAHVWGRCRRLCRRRLRLRWRCLLLCRCLRPAARLRLLDGRIGRRRRRGGRVVVLPLPPLWRLLPRRLVLATLYRLLIRRRRRPAAGRCRCRRALARDARQAAGRGGAADAATLVAAGAPGAAMRAVRGAAAAAAARPPRRGGLARRHVVQPRAGVLHRLPLLAAGSRDLRLSDRLELLSEAAARGIGKRFCSLCVRAHRRLHSDILRTICRRISFNVCWV